MTEDQREKPVPDGSNVALASRAIRLINFIRGPNFSWDQESSRLKNALAIAQIIAVLLSVPAGLFIFLRYEALQKDLSLKQLRNTAEISRVQLEKQLASRIEGNHELIPYLLTKGANGKNLYGVTLEVSVKNISDVDIAITDYYIDTFYGVLEEGAYSEPDLVRVYNPGANLANAPFPSIITWRLTSREHFIQLSDEVQNEEEMSAGEDAQTGGTPHQPADESKEVNVKPDSGGSDTQRADNIRTGEVETGDGTGLVRSGETVGFAYDYIVQGDGAEFAGFYVEVGVRSGQETYWWQFNHWVRLSEEAESE